MVAICDDGHLCRNHLYGILNEYRTGNRVQMEIYQFNRGTDLLSSVRRFDLIFLGYPMPGLNGMAAARNLCQRNMSCSIVFITSYTQFVPESFEVPPRSPWNRVKYGKKRTSARMSFFLRVIAMLSLSGRFFIKTAAGFC